MPSASAPAEQSTEPAAQPRRGLSLASVSTPWLQAMGVLGSSVSVALLLRGVLGTTGLFRYQLCAFLTTLSVAPAISRAWNGRGDDQVDNGSAASGGDEVAKVRWGLVLVGMVWMVACGGPVFYAILLELFTGHQRPGAQWYDAVWRVYAILGMWIFFSLAIEKHIKPTWVKYRSGLLGSLRGTGAPASESVAVQAERMAIERRERKLEQLQSKMNILLRRKKRLEARVQTLESSLEQTDESGNQSQARNDEADATLSEFKEDLEDVNDRITLLRQEWHEAQHIENYRAFYR